MTLHRFFLPAGAFQGEHVHFPPDVSRQIDRVLRLRPGCRVVALDGSGREATVLIEGVGRHVAGRIEAWGENEAEPAAKLSLYQGVLKGAKMDFVLQKGTEVGVSAFRPFISAHSVAMEPGEAKRDRWEAIVREAAEQSGRGRLPEIAAPLSLEEATREAVAAGPTVLLWEGERALLLRDVPLPADTGAISLVIGPEGGLSEEEVEAARSAGAIVASLGKRILRGETAGVVGAALLLAQLGEIG